MAILPKPPKRISYVAFAVTDADGQPLSLGEGVDSILAIPCLFAKLDLFVCLYARCYNFVLCDLPGKDDADEPAESEAIIPFYICGSNYAGVESDLVCPAWAVPRAPDAKSESAVLQLERKATEATFALESDIENKAQVSVKYELCFLSINKAALESKAKCTVKLIGTNIFLVLDRQRLLLDRSVCICMCVFLLIHCMIHYSRR